MIQRIGIAVYIFNDKDEILLGKRKNAHGDGEYAPPGGHLEYGENFEECAKREAMEEAGITLKNISVAGVTNDLFESIGRHYVTISLTAQLDSGVVETKEPHKCEGWEWHRWGDFPPDLFLPVANLRKQIKELTWKKSSI
ncbi:MAG: NUDIX hydrolase [Firmicutes bacterium]|nr:NUDIX hydrolase [Bacillota bacterium]